MADAGRHCGEISSPHIRVLASGADNGTTPPEHLCKLLGFGAAALNQHDENNHKQHTCNYLDNRRTTHSSSSFPQ
jgi:hypothetical protein